MGKEFDAAALVEELRDVFASGKTRSLEWRLEQLNGLVRFATERSDEIAEALRQDLNKPKREAVAYEVDGVRYSALGAAASVKEWMQPAKVITPVPGCENGAIIPEPLGLTLVIAPWNYPIILCVDPLIGALAAGNVVVIKPSELTPASAALLAKLLPLYVDPTAVRVVEGGIPESTALLEQRWDKIFYTGSTRVGRIVMQAAAKHLTPVTLELGGKSPTIVDATADLDVVARRLCHGKWGTNYGQVCVAPDYVLAEEAISKDLVKKLKGTIHQFYGEDPSSSKHLGRVINADHFKRLTGLMHDEGTVEKIIEGGDLNEKTLYIAPTIILDPPMDSPVMQEEIFGPLLVIVTVKDIAEAVKVVNSRAKPLALYIFSGDEEVVDKVLHQTSSGGVTVNDIFIHVKHPGLPFGGVGESGMGSYHGKHSFMCFSHMKGISYQKLTGDVASNYPPFA